VETFKIGARRSWRRPDLAMTTATNLRQLRLSELVTSRSTWGLIALLCAAIALFSYRYLFGTGPRFEVIAGNKLSNPWLVVHVATAATALLVAPLQFLAGLRSRSPGLHRWVGRMYVTCCILGALTGLVLSLGASTGPITTAGFGLLAITWLYTTVLGWRTARDRCFAEHRRWMIRSFALTFAAVTLRAYLPLLQALPIAFNDGYRAISFLCWLPNLLVAEWYLHRRRLPRPTTLV
jgi:uncharacterized membrane protein